MAHKKFWRKKQFSQLAFGSLVRPSAIAAPTPRCSMLDVRRGRIKADLEPGAQARNPENA
jgi:hypothetical protein